MFAAATIASAAYLNAKYNIVDDIKALYGMKVGTAEVVNDLYKKHGENDWSLYHLLHETHTRLGPEASEKEALLFEGRTWSYHDLVTDIAKVERKLKEMGIQCGDLVAMIVNNSPEFMITIFALWKIGAVPGPINTSLTAAPLKHCLAITRTKFIVTTNELLPATASTLQDYAFETPATKILCYDYDTYPSLPFYAFEVTHIRHSTLPPGDTSFTNRPHRIPEDPCMLLYTSGTTGRPKAVKWPSGYSMLYKSSRWPYLHQATDRWYCALPCFHGTATWACICPVWGQGGTIVLARKFSTSNFWRDVVDGQCNAVIYIGEMCRYLAQAERSKWLVPDERTGHNVRKMFGLGMSAKSWAVLRERFGVDLIAEYWSATEATGSLINMNRNGFGLGSTGRQSFLMRMVSKNIVILRRDFETEDLVRDPKTGLCIQCEDDEPGEVVTKVDRGGGILLRHSYLDNEKATNEKVVRGVLEKDDEYTRIGDLLVRDKDGFIKFMDRLGHGWRNKGHNISASEVELVLATHPAVVSTSAFPIAMNKYGYEGQLGCCVLTVVPGTSEREIHGMEEYMLKGGLPVYAIPRFVRIVETDAVGVSAVFKKQKEDYKAIGKRHGHSLLEHADRTIGFEPKDGDVVYWIQRERDGYEKFDLETMNRVKSGKARL